MIQFICVSDIHFGKHMGSHGCRDDERAQKISRIRDRYFDDNNDAYLIAAGDIADDGKVSQFRNGLTALTPFARKVLLTPGNHDYGKTGLAYNSKSAKNFDAILTASLHAKRNSSFFAKTEPVLKIITDSAGNEKVLTIGLNSNLKTNTYKDLACGEIGNSQLTALKKILAKKAYRDLPKLLYLHHHPFLRYDLEDIGLKLYDSELLMAVVSGKVDALIFGHKHLRQRFQSVEEISDIPVIVATGYFPSENSTWSLTVQGGKITAELLPV